LSEEAFSLEDRRLALLLAVRPDPVGVLAFADRMEERGDCRAAGVRKHVECCWRSYNMLTAIADYGHVCPEPQPGWIDLDTCIKQRLHGDVKFIARKLEMDAPRPFALFEEP
jgi:hypothetical protein